MENQNKVQDKNDEEIAKERLEVSPLKKFQEAASPLTKITYEENLTSSLN